MIKESNIMKPCLPITCLQLLTLDQLSFIYMDSSTSDPPKWVILRHIPDITLFHPNKHFSIYLRIWTFLKNMIISFHVIMIKHSSIYSLFKTYSI